MRLILNRNHTLIGAKFKCLQIISTTFCELSLPFPPSKLSGGKVKRKPRFQQQLTQSLQRICKQQVKLHY